MKKLIGLLLLISLTTAYAQTTPAGKDTSGAKMGNTGSGTGNSKSETGSSGTTGSQGTIADSPMDEVENNTCTTASGKELKRADKGFNACLKSHHKKK